MSRVVVYAGFATLLAACAVVSVVDARGGGDTSTWEETTVCQVGCSGTYHGVYTLSSSTLSGSLSSGGETFAVTATRNGDSLTLHNAIPGYSSDAKGTLSADGKSMSGTFTDTRHASGTWTATLTSGPPAVVKPSLPAGGTTCTTASTAKVAALPTQPIPGGGGVILDTRLLKGGSTIGIDLSGDRHPDYVGASSLPYVGITTPTGVTATVGVTASCGSSTTASTSLKLRIPGLGLPADHVPTTVVFAAKPAFWSDSIGLACFDSSIVQDLIDARGCFKQYSSPNQVPAAERATAQAYYGSTILPGWLASQQPCKTDACTKLTNLFAKAYKVYGSKGSIRLNGLTITPAGGHEVILDPDALRIFSSDATVSLGSIRLESGQIDLDFTNVIKTTGKAKTPTSYNGFTQPVLTFDPRKGLPVIGGFPLNAGAELAFAAVNGVRESKVTVHVELPAIFDVFGSGPQPSAAGSGVATNDAPFKISTLDFSIPHASIKGIGFDDLSFHYSADGDKDADCPRSYWHATAAIHLGKGPNGEPGAGFELVPPPSQNGIAFCGGSFKSAGGKIDFGVPIPPPEIFPAVFLNSINFAIQLDPLLIRGGGTISAAQLFNVSGTLLAAFASPGQPYTLTRSDAGAELQDLAPRTFTSTTFAVGGALALTVPGIGVLNIAHGGILYSYPDYLYAAAHVDAQLGIFYFKGGLTAQLNARTKQFEADLDAHICVQKIDLCGGGLGILSSRGAVACLDLAGFHPGVGVSTDGHVEIWVGDGCKPSHYWVRDIATHGTRLPAAAGTLSFVVAPGETAKNVRIAGIGGAPKVVVQGPSGERLTLDGAGFRRSGALAGVRADTYKATYLGIVHGKPGRYTVTALSGSVPLGQLRETRPGYDSTFTGKVTPHGAGFTLAYDAGKAGGGQQVTFYEEGANVMHEIGSSSGGRGNRTFIPAPGIAGERTIVARATIDGVPIRDQVIARFRFAGTPRAGRPGKVIAVRKGTTLVVSWQPAAGAVSYGIAVDRSGGTQQVLEVSARRTTVRITHFPPTEGGVVSVSARGALGDWGPAGQSAQFEPVSAPPSIFRARLH